MDILVTRSLQGKNTTLSPVTVNGKHQCYCLEDIDRGLTQHMLFEEIKKRKIPKITAIPAGKYQVKITWSPAFQRMLPILEYVPGYAGIRIHSGNKHTNTEGCLITGKAYDFVDEDYVIRGGTSRPAFDELFKKIQEALKAGEEVWITIKTDYKQ